MSAKRIGIMNIRQILQLKEAGQSNRSISQLTGMHRNTVNEYVRILEAHELGYTALLQWSDEELSNLFPQTTTTDKNRYETLSSYFPYFIKELKKLGCTRLALWREYLAKHPDEMLTTQRLAAWIKTRSNDWPIWTF